MRQNAVPLTSRLPVPWLRKHRFALDLAGCFFLSALATVFVGLAPAANLIWVANGVLLAYLLLAPRWRWPAYVITAFAAQEAGGILINHDLRMNLLLGALNIAEVLIGALLLRRKSTQLPRFTERRYLLRFLGYAVLAGPLATGAVYALIAAFGWQADPVHELLNWVTADGLGAAVTTPAWVAIFRTRLRDTAQWKKHWAYPTVLAVVSIGAFSQTKVPLLFLIYPLLILVLLRLGLGWAALAALFVATVGSWYTIRGLGPFAMEKSFSEHGPTILLQLHIASGMFMLYAVSVVLEHRRAAERRLRESVSLHNLVTENSRDVIILADFDGNRRYVSAAAQSMGGWTSKEMVEFGSFGLVHPEDRPKAEAVLQKLRSGTEVATIECRARRRDGVYIWVECSLRVVRDPATGVPTGILNIIRDITERKDAEQLRGFQHSLIRAIHAVSQDGVLVVNGEGKVVSHNKRFTDVWGISMPEIPANLNGIGLGVKDEDLLSQCLDLVKDRDAFLKRIREVYADPDANDHSQVELKDGRTLERYSSSLRTDAGENLGRVWFFRDISERIQAEKKLKDAYRTVETLAVTDALTGLANRRRFDQCLASEWRRGLRDHGPLSMLLIDVDLFKSYNDAFGHLRGDSCLKQIAESALDVVTRSGDLVARFGGEEFAIILPHTSNEGAMQVANEICEALRQRRLPHSGSPLGIMTVSVGCATIVPTFGLHGSDLIEMADKALYRAKRGGRNQVCNENAAKSGPEDPVQKEASSSRIA